MNQKSVGLMFVLILALVGVLSAQVPPRPPPGGMKLLPGYAHEPKQGFDSIVGVIEKKEGLTIMYEIGRVAKPGGPAPGTLLKSPRGSSVARHSDHSLLPFRQLYSHACHSTCLRAILGFRRRIGA